MNNPYKYGLERIARVMMPSGARIKLRAVMATDGSELEIAGSDTRKAVCHEVMAIGPDASDCSDISVGMHCLHISAAGDEADQDTKSSRTVFVHVDDIVAYWWPKDAAEEDANLAALAND